MGTAEAAVLQVALLTGQRSSEIIHMRWQDIEMIGVSETPINSAWWNLPGAPQGDWPGRKTGASHRVFLSPLVLSIITVASGDRDPAGRVFGNKRLRLDRTMAAACKAAGIEPVRPHDCRRSFATLVARYFGRGPVSRVLGHSDRSIAAVYDRHSYADEDRAIWEKISEHIFNLINGDSFLSSRMFGGNPGGGVAW